MNWVGWIPWFVATVFALAGAVCVLLVALQLPGTWLLLALALLVELCDGLWLSTEQPATFGWTALWIALGIALVGELVEFLAGALGVRVGGGTKRGFWGALLGGIVGFFLFTPLFWFVPLFGSLLGALLGTFVGAFIAESRGERARAGEALKPAVWATIGRVLGTTGKLALAMAMWGLLAFQAFANA